MQGRPSLKWIDRLCEELFLTRRAKEQDDNLLFVRERMLRSEVDLAGLLTLYAGVHRGKRVRDDETNPFVTNLSCQGRARRRGRLRVRNRIYQRVFDREWVPRTCRMPSCGGSGRRTGGVYCAPRRLRP